MTTEPPAPRPRPSEQILLEAVPRVTADRVSCTSLGRAQFAAAVAAGRPQSHVVCNFLDLYQAEQAQAAWPRLPNLEILCQSDLPPGPYDLVAIPLTAQGDGELARDWLQAGHETLCTGGALWATTDNPRDRWLHDALSQLFDKVTCERSGAGVLYRAVKTRPLKKVKNYTCQFAFRDRGRLLTAVSRPGVFSHRHIDTGARALIETMDVRPGARVLELGCGSGVVSLAAAARAADVHVLAVDSNPRAAACTARGAELNGLANVHVQLAAVARADVPGSYDLAVANPPYYSRHRIAELFIQGAADALRPGGQILVVTKGPDWFCQALAPQFEQITVMPLRGYAVVRGRRRRGP